MFENMFDGYLVLIGWAGGKHGDWVMSFGEPWLEPEEELPGLGTVIVLLDSVHNKLVEVVMVDTTLLEFELC